MHESGVRVDGWRDALAPLIDDPTDAAVFCDLDGTLAPIVARPELAAVPDRVQGALRRIAARYALCAIVTGRRPEDARAIVGIDEIAYAGNHGFELLEPGAERSLPSPEVAGKEDAAAGVVVDIADREALARAGVRVEDKGLIVALHWRGAADERAAERAAAALADEARGRGLRIHGGRKVLEIRPPAAIDKGVAITGMLRRAGARRALYAGDDRTDLDGFRALAALRDDGELDAIVRIGVDSPEGPEEVAAEADVVVDCTAGFADLLEALAEGG